MPRSQPGELHGRWKGEAATQHPKHRFISRRKTKTGVCTACRERPKPYKNNQFGTDWANIKGHVYSHNPDDYVELCRSCHMLYDHGKIDL
jgi:hypothetical protein